MVFIFLFGLHTLPSLGSELSPPLFRFLDCKGDGGSCKISATFSNKFPNDVQFSPSASAAFSISNTASISSLDSKVLTLFPRAGWAVEVAPGSRPPLRLGMAHPLFFLGLAETCESMLASDVYPQRDFWGDSAGPIRLGPSSGALPLAFLFASCFRRARTSSGTSDFAGFLPFCARNPSLQATISLDMEGPPAMLLLLLCASSLPLFFLFTRRASRRSFPGTA
mmetsp:Transcript_10189/g.25851  ORF Transcript_10189/g.25851 Transcript_10189/m.25851 type:complete len:223 (+) Transcript_10189:46-714(+)